MEPIVSPWLFYIINVLDSLEGLCSVTAFISFVIAYGYLIEYSEKSKVIEEGEAESEAQLTKITAKVKYYKKCFKGWTCFFILSVLLIVAIPTKETMYKMLVASFVTNDNISLVVEKTGDILEVSATKLVQIISDAAIKIIESTK